MGENMKKYIVESIIFLLNELLCKRKEEKSTEMTKFSMLSLNMNRTAGKSPMYDVTL